jgi:cell division protein FtsB
MKIAKNIPVILMLIVAGILIVSGISTYTKLNKAKVTIEEARLSAQKLEDEQKNLKDQIAQTESSQFIEKQLRDKLGMAKTGEVVLVLPESQELKRLAPPKTQEEEYIPKKNWEKWRELFF